MEDEADFLKQTSAVTLGYNDINSKPHKHVFLSVFTSQSVSHTNSRLQRHQLKTS